MREATCTGAETQPNEDGPIVYACTRPGCDCKARAQVKVRYIEPGFTAAMLADMPNDEEW